MYRSITEARGDLFACDQQETLTRAKYGIEALGIRQVVVVCQGEEVVAVLLVPPRHRIWGTVAVAVDGVGVQIALVPVQRRRLAGEHA